MANFEIKTKKILDKIKELLELVDTDCNLQINYKMDSDFLCISHEVCFGYPSYIKVVCPVSEDECLKIKQGYAPIYTTYEKIKGE